MITLIKFEGIFIFYIHKLVGDNILHFTHLLLQLHRISKLINKYMHVTDY